MHGPLYYWSMSKTNKHCFLFTFLHVFLILLFCVLYADSEMDNRQAIRPHITKEQRLPKCFKEVEKILKSVKSCQKNYKTILANSRLRGNIHKKVYSMTVNVLKNYNYIQKIIDKIQLLEKEKYLRKEIAAVLIYELLFGRGFLPGESKIVKTVQLYENDIFYAHEVLQNTIGDSLNAGINIPRYVRVHTLVTTVPYVIKDLITYGFHQVVYDDDLLEEKYLELVKNLKPGSFLIDFHFKDVLVFEHHENLTSLDLYKNNHIILQDKSSYIPVQVLNPKPYCAVLDACAAPGMKTLHIAAKMKNKGVLIACERDKDRFECLKKILDSGSVKICKTLCKDFKLIDPCDQAYSNVEYILLDPSCSGSGMVNRLDEITDTEDSKNKERLMKLAGFQIILLKHSLKFPSVKRVVYSTCSVHEEENEYVVHEALKAFGGTFKLMPAMPEWSYRGSENFEFGKLCLRTDPKVHLTNGFFVALFERINNDECQDNFYDSHCQDFAGHKKSKKKSQKPEESYRHKASEDYIDINLEPECNSLDPFETHYTNDSEHIALLSKDGEPAENSIQNVNSEQEQNLINTQKICKKHKKKKKEKSKEDSCQTNKLNIEMPCEPVFKHSKLKKHSQNLFSENNDDPHAYKMKEKIKKKKYEFKQNSFEGVEVEEKFANVTKSHKKKKKDRSPTLLQSEEKSVQELSVLNQEQPNAFSVQKCDILKIKQGDNTLQSEIENTNAAHFMNESTQNKPIKNLDFNESSELINTFSHKKKKKKKYLKMDDSQSCDKLNESYTSLFHINSPQSIGDMSENNDATEKVADSTTSNKRKKKKKKYSLENEV